MHLIFVESPRKAQRLTPMLTNARIVPLWDDDASAWRGSLLMALGHAKNVMRNALKDGTGISRYVVVTDATLLGDAVAETASRWIGRPVHHAKMTRWTDQDIMAAMRRSSGASPVANASLEVIVMADRMARELYTATASRAGPFPGIAEAAALSLWPQATVTTDVHRGWDVVFDFGQWTARWLGGDESGGHGANATRARQIAKATQVVVKSWKESFETAPAPAPLTTTALITGAVEDLGLSIEMAWHHALELYMDGHITLPACSVNRFTWQDEEAVYRYAEGKGIPVTERKVPRPVDRAPLAQSSLGVHAIACTHWQTEEAGRSTQSRSLYRFIRSKGLACVGVAATLRSRDLELIAETPDGPVVLRAEGRTCVHAGWLAYDPLAMSHANHNAGLPALAEGQVIPVVRSGIRTAVPPLNSRPAEAQWLKRITAEGLVHEPDVMAVRHVLYDLGLVKRNAAGLLLTSQGLRVVANAQRVFGGHEGLLAAARLLWGGLIDAANGQIPREAVRPLGRLLQRAASGQKGAVPGARAA